MAFLFYAFNRNDACWPIHYPPEAVRLVEQLIKYCDGKENALYAKRILNYLILFVYSNEKKKRSKTFIYFSSTGIEMILFLSLVMKCLRFGIVTILKFINTNFYLQIHNPFLLILKCLGKFSNNKSLKVHKILMYLPNNRNLSNTEIDTQLNNITTIISATMDKIIPKTTTGNCLNLKLPQSIVNLITQKRKKNFRLSISNNHIFNQQMFQLKSEITCLSNLIKQNLIQYYNNKLTFNH